MLRTNRLFLLGALGLAVLLSATPAAQAQSNTTGAVQGTVIDEATGGPLAGVAVMATSSVLQGTQSELTDADGHYYIGNLPPGTYELSFYYSDITVKRTNVIVGLNKVTAVNSKINTGQAKGEVITITEKTSSIDVGSTTQGVNITNDYTRNIPTGRSYTGVLGAAAGAQGDSYGTSFSGSTSIENSYIIDGINTTGLTYGTVGSTLLNNFIQEMEVLTGGYDAEYGRSTGGVVNVITRSGTNEFHGSVFMNVSPIELAADDIFVEGSAIDSESYLNYSADFGFDVGGPIIKDKLWFYVGFAPAYGKRSYIRKVRTRVDRQVNGNNYAEVADPDGDPTTTTDPLCYLTGTCEADGVADKDPTTGLTLWEEIDRETWNNKSASYQVTGKLSFMVNPDHQGQVSFIGSTYGDSGAAAITGTPRATHTDDSSYTGDVSVKWTSKFMDNKTEVDAVVGWHTYATDTQPTYGTQADGSSTYDTPRSVINSTNLGRVGRNPDRPESSEVLDFCTDASAGDPARADAFPTITNCPVSGYRLNSIGWIGTDDEDRVMGKVSLTQRLRAMGHHEVKLGADLENNMTNTISGYSGGAYTANYGSFWYIRRYVRASDYGDAAAEDYCMAGDEVVPCSFLDKFETHNTTMNWATYLQDKWQILPNLTVRAGLRYEQQLIGYADEVAGIIDPITGEPLDSTALNLNNLWAPRLGVLYDWTKEGRSKVYAHWGRFYESVPMDMNHRAFGGEVTNDTYYPSDQCGEPLVDSAGVTVIPSESRNCPSIDPNDDTTWPGYGGDVMGGTYLIAPDVKPQYMDEVVAGVEYEVMEDLNVGLSYQNRRIGRVIEDVSPDGGYTYILSNPGEFSSDAEADLEREIEGTTDPDLRAALEEKLETLKGIRVFDKPRRDYNAVTLTAKKRFSRSFFVQGSYTYSILRGNYPGLFSPDTDQLDPNITSQYDLIELLANRDGPLPHDRPHSLKIDGYYTYDLKEAGRVTGGARLRATSGVPINTLGNHLAYGRMESFILPRGTWGRTAFRAGADLHVGYGRKLTPKMDLEVFLDLFNVFNSQTQAYADEEYTLDYVNPIVGGTKEDLTYAKALDEDGYDSGATVVRQLNYGNTASRYSPLAGRIGLVLTF